METKPRLSTEKRIITDTISEFSLQATESVGPTQLPPTVTPDTLPPGFDTYKSLPVLVGTDYGDPIQSGKSRYGQDASTGIGFTITAEGTYVRPEFSLRMKSRTRAEAWSFINFFDSRAGKLFPFYVISPSREFSIDTPYTTGFTANPMGPEVDWAQFTDVAILLKDGTYLYREITFLVRSSNLDILLYDSAMTAQQTLDAVKIIPLYLSRLSSDSMKETWTTTEAMRSTLSTVAVHEEKSVTLTDLVEISTTPVAGAFNVLQCSGSCWKLKNCNTPAEVMYTDLNLITLFNKNKIISLVEFPFKCWSITRSNPCGGSITTPLTLDQVYGTCEECPTLSVFSPDAANCWESVVCGLSVGSFPYVDTSNSGQSGTGAFCIVGQMDSICLQDADQGGTYRLECVSGRILDLNLAYNSGDSWTSGGHTRWVYDVSFEYVSG